LYQVLNEQVTVPLGLHSAKVQVQVPVQVPVPTFQGPVLCIKYRHWDTQHKVKVGVCRT